MRQLNITIFTLLLAASRAAAGPLSLAEAEKEMLAANPQAASAARSLDAARARLAAAGDALYPYV
jgi:hypothetical protein